MKGGLAEEKSRDLLARASSHVFRHLLRFDPNFDFDSVIAPMPEVIQGALGDWVEDHVDDLIAEFSLAGGEDWPLIKGRESDGGGSDSGDGDSTSP